MKIGITINSKSYTPEAYAYEKHLRKKNIDIQLSDELDPNNDINLYFLGIKTKKTEGKCIEIHEYHSLSTPPFAKFKDLIKKNINCKPNARIFLNSAVHERINFSDNISYLHRDMGVDLNFFQTPNENPLFDIVYCGSISGRTGLLAEIQRLAKNGFKICVIGNINTEFKKELSKYKNIHFTGKLKRNEIPEIYKNSYAGLNFTPDKYPFNIQTSTKTIEYLASGLQCISNNYFWIKKISSERNFEYLLNTKLSKPDDLYAQKKISVNVRDLEWNHMLETIGFYNFLCKQLYR